MREACLFIAMGLDGYIADHEGRVDWLKGQGDPHDDFDPYPQFVETIDTILMGRNTYRQIVTELSPQAWPYSAFTTYVLTHTQQAATENIQFVSTDPVALVNTLKKEKGKNIWICGGADLVRQMVKGDSIDRYHITVIPTLLGSGIRLFEAAGREIPLRLLYTRAYNGMTDLVYTRR